MFLVYQSNDSRYLATLLGQFYKNDSRNIFDEFSVIVPAKVLENWLKNKVAGDFGISTMMTAQFWGQYQWQMIERVLELERQYLKATNNPKPPMQVPKTALLSSSVMQWQMFSYLSTKNDNKATKKNRLDVILEDENHPLFELLNHLGGFDNSTAHQQDIADRQKKLWQFCHNIARVFTKYLIERDDWLMAWANNGAVDVMAMIAQKDKFGTYFNQMHDVAEQETEDYSTPLWLVAYYQSLERALAFLWRTLFAKVYSYRKALETRFWEVVETGLFGNYFDAEYQAKLKNSLPSHLYLFTVQQVPQIELDFLHRLSLSIDVVLLHFNPSKMFWADIVDKNWLSTQNIINPATVYQKDSGHELLSRLGKSSREAFAMLAQLSGNAWHHQDDGSSTIANTPKLPNLPYVSAYHQSIYQQISANFVVQWQDIFSTPSDNTLLSALKKDILMLNEGDEDGDFNNHLGQFLQSYLGDELVNNPKLNDPKTNRSFAKDNSISIHRCHSLKRELELARLVIARYLSASNADGSTRKLSDVAIMLPDVERHHTLIKAVFGESAGIDGLYLPTKITGVIDDSVEMLWRAIVGLYQLQAVGRFEANDVFEWLCLPYVYGAFDLSFEMAQRACTLLKKAGFVRGLNEVQIKQHLSVNDDDYRHHFAYALDRLSVSLIYGVNDASDDGNGTLVDMFYPFEGQDCKSQSEFAPKTQIIAGVSLEDTPIINALTAMYQAWTQFASCYNEYRSALAWLDHIEYQLIEHYFGIFKSDEAMRSIFGAINAMKKTIATKSYHQNQNSTANSNDEIILPLSLVLDSLFEAVSGQQISAEPSGVIVLGRFGSLRSIDFGLVVMVGMNLSAFPRTEPINRLDLSEAGIKRRGDRISEDDDNGAFLEALLLARDEVAIFYTAFNADGTPAPPASPVGVLIDFLQNNVKRCLNRLTDTSDNTILDNKANFSINLETLEGWLIYDHNASPFEKSVFVGQSYYDEALPPPPIWQKVYQMMHAHSTPKPPVNAPADDKMMAALAAWVGGTDCDYKFDDLLDDFDANLPEQITIEKIAGRIKKPAKAFLQNKIYLMDKEALGDEVMESLVLDKLDNYQLFNRLLLGEDSLYYGDLLPAGVAKKITFDETKNKIDDLKNTLITNLNQHQLPTPNPLLSRCYPLIITLSDEDNEQNPITIDITSVVPVLDGHNKDDIWCNLVASNYRDEKLVDAYLLHLCHQIQGGRRSCWQYRCGKFVLFEVKSADKARLTLLKWLKYAHILPQYPVALTVENAVIWLKNTNASNDDKKDPSDKSLYKNWLNSNTYGHVYDNRSIHDHWQKVLGITDPMQAFLDSRPFIELIYQEMLEDRVFG